MALLDFFHGNTLLNEVRHTFYDLYTKIINEFHVFYLPSKGANGFVHL